MGATITLSDVTGSGTWSSSGSAASVGSSSGIVTGMSAGTATISYTVSNSCGNAFATESVTVIAIPSPGVISGMATVCPTASITLADAAGGGIWSASNALATVSAGLVTGVSAGVDTISYTVSNVCGAASATKTITINPLPSAGSITGASGVCIAASVTLSDGVAGGVWSSADATVTVGSSSGMVTGVSGGTALISYSVTTVCGAAVATYTINVITIPTAGTISGATTVCQGANITLMDGITGGVWSVSNATATAGTSSGVVTGVSAGVDTITYTVSYTCGSAYATYTITINPLPSPAAISGSGSVCLGATLALSDITGGGVWSAANGHATVSGTGLVTAVTAGVDTINYSVTNGCGTVAATHTVTVSPIVTPVGSHIGHARLHFMPRGAGHLFGHACLWRRHTGLPMAGKWRTGSHYAVLCLCPAQW